MLLSICEAFERRKHGKKKPQIKEIEAAKVPYQQRAMSLLKKLYGSAHEQVGLAVQKTWTENKEWFLGGSTVAGPRDAPSF